MTSARTLARRGFSLIELVIVIVIIGIIAAIAIPRMSRGAEGANDSALKANLAVLRSAIDLYHTEHEGKYPTAGKFVEQLTTYTDLSGADSATQTGSYIYGPYLREIPVLPVGANKGSAAVNVTGTQGGAQGWLYDPATGRITANLAAGDADKAGKDYNSY